MRALFFLCFTFVLLDFASTAPPSESILRFEDVTEARGLAGDTDSYDGAFADMDGDGDLDLVVCNHGAQVSLFENDGTGRFRDVAVAMKLGAPDDYHGFAIADVDADGRLDIYWTVGDNRGSFTRANRLFLNRGDHYALSTSFVYEDRRGRGRGAMFLDLLPDGRPDLVVTNFASPASLCIHDGKKLEDLARRGKMGSYRGQYVVAEDFDEDGTLDLIFSGQGPATYIRYVNFQPVSRELPDSEDWRGLSAADLDGDGHMDLIVARRGNYRDHLVQLRGEVRARIHLPRESEKRVVLTPKEDRFNLMIDWEGKWWSPSELRREPTLAKLVVEDLSTKEKVLEPGDISVTRSGRDVVIRAKGVKGRGPIKIRALGEFEAARSEVLNLKEARVPLSVYRGGGDGTFSPWKPKGLELPMSSVVPLVEDLDHDGHLDMYVIGRGDKIATSLNTLFLGDGQGGFVEVTESAGAAGPSRGVAFGGCLGDVDGDGDLDIFVVKGDLPPEWGGGPRALLLNQLESDRHWIQVLPRRKDHRTILGALVILEAGGRTQKRRIGLQGHPLSRGVRAAHFGLGSVERVDRVRVEFSDGGSIEVEDLAVDRLHTLDE